MPIPPISPIQAVQLGMAAKAVGSAVTDVFSDLLKSAMKLVSGEDDGNASAAAIGAVAEVETNRDVDVLRRQIRELLSTLHARIRSVVESSGARIPEGGLTLQNRGVQLRPAIPGSSSDGLARMLEGDDDVQRLLQSIRARRTLLQAAETSKAVQPVESQRLRITPQATVLV